jgi:hypothetical protein
MNSSGHLELTKVFNHERSEAYSSGKPKIGEIKNMGVI